MPVEVVLYPDGPRTVRAVGVRHGSAVGFRWGFWPDEHIVQTSFLLPEEGFLIAQPVGFPAGQPGWWYCDLVSVDGDGDGAPYVVRDLYIDVIIGPPEHPYRVLDLDEHADAMATGVVPVEQGLDGLRRTQRFLDSRLNRRDTTRAWPDFPPADVRALLARDDLPGEWIWTPNH